MMLLEKYLLGTRLQEIRWSRRRLSDEDLLRHLNESPRTFLTDEFERYYPFESILDFGCGSGATLLKLARKHPELTLFGVDVNDSAIKVARKGLSEQVDGSHVLLKGSANALKTFNSKSIDITTENSTLMFIGPDKLTGVINEMVRITRRRLVFLDWNYFDSSDLTQHSFLHQAHWVHDYKKHLVGLLGIKEVSVRRLPVKNWNVLNDHNWERFGAIITCTLET